MSDSTPPSITTTSLQELTGTPADTAHRGLDQLLDMSLPVVIEFGRTAMTVQEVLALAPGSVVQLERMVGESVDIYVSDRRLAEGEVVVVGEHFGVRITRMVGTSRGTR
jgi:flagellar motor switch protein FliN/FliY